MSKLENSGKSKIEFVLGLAGSDVLLKAIMAKQQSAAPLPHDASRLRKDVDQFPQLDEATAKGHAEP